jgi:hypothetical protein
MKQDREPPGGGSWLEKKLCALEALYHKFGRDGLKDHPIADVALLLSAKELRLRDAAKSPGLDDEQRAINRRLELEVKDLTVFMKGQVSGLSLSDLRAFRQADRPPQYEPQKRRDFDRER